MSKRIIALLLCAVMLLPCLAGCKTATKDKDDLGAYITMYLTDNIYDLDPANAYYNQDTLNVVSLLYDTLFTLDSNGKVKNSLVKKYTIKEDQEKEEYTMELRLNETWWSNKVRLSADDVVYAWKRLLNSNNSSSAAALLYDVKNARAVKEGDTSIDNIGVEAVALDIVKITFEGPINYDQFLLNLTSVATAPLLESYVDKNADWAKKPSTMVTSGAYKLGKIKYSTVLKKNSERPETTKDDYAFDKNNELDDKYSGAEWSLMKLDYFYLERNVNYYRDASDEDVAIDAKVKNYRILVDCSKTDEEILEEYKNGRIFYMGSIPLSLRNDEFVKANVQLTDALSTFVCHINQNALVDDDGYKETPGKALFADERVRQALSLAIDRNAIANEIIYAKAATGLVCPGVFSEGKISDQDFRTVGGDLVSTNVQAAQELIAAVKNEGLIDEPSKYNFSIKVASYDTENVKIAEMIAKQWKDALGFNVKLEKVTPIVNNDVLKELANTANPRPADICDDIFVEAIQRGNYEVIAFDYNAYTPDAYSMLANFALSFSGASLEKETYALRPHASGYNSTEYNNLMEAIYYIPYFATLTDTDYDFLGGIYATVEEFQEVYNAVEEIYTKYDIQPSVNKADWTAQKALLLHEAEKLLLNDAVVIPVLFNQHASMTSADLTNIESNFYTPAFFKNAELANYKDYFAALENFPKVNWDATNENPEESTADTSAAAN